MAEYPIGSFGPDDVFAFGAVLPAEFLVAVPPRLVLSALGCAAGNGPLFPGRFLARAWLLQNGAVVQLLKAWRDSPVPKTPPRLFLHIRRGGCSASGESEY